MFVQNHPSSVKFLCVPIFGRRGTFPNRLLHASRKLPVRHPYDHLPQGSFMFQNSVDGLCSASLASHKGSPLFPYVCGAGPVILIFDEESCSTMLREDAPLVGLEADSCTIPCRSKCVCLPCKARLLSSKVCGFPCEVCFQAHSL